MTKTPVILLLLALQDVDWEDNPALGIFCHDSTAYLVAREGLMMSDYGKVDTRKAKERLLHGECKASAQWHMLQLCDCEMLQHHALQSLSCFGVLRSHPAHCCFHSPPFCCRWCWQQQQRG